MRAMTPEAIRRFDRKVIGFSAEKIRIEHAKTVVAGKGEGGGKTGGKGVGGGAAEWTPPSPVSSLTCRAWKLLLQATRDVHGDIPVSHMVRNKRK